jgi:GNAT superfamily N-acetyltransferase
MARETAGRFGTRIGKDGSRRETFTRWRYRSDSGWLDVEIYDVPAGAGAFWEPHPVAREGLAGQLRAEASFRRSALRAILFSCDVVALDPFPAPDGGRGLPDGIRRLEAAERIARGRVEIEIQEVEARRRGDHVGRALLCALERFARGITLLSTGERPVVAIEGEPVPGNGVAGGRGGLVEFYRKCGYLPDGRMVRKLLRP